MKKTVLINCLIVCWLTVSNTYALDTSTLHGKIVFSSSETDSVGDIFIMNPDGSGKQNISNDPGMHSMEPFISYDGTQITWYGGVAHQAQIYVSDIDGGNIHTITSDGYNNVCPAFSPDGQEIAFIRYFAGGSLCVIPAIGGPATTLAGGGLGFPHWSPSGDKITYTDWDSGYTADIYVINADGINNTLIAASPGYNNLRSMWSPDGSKIAYTSDKDGTGDVWIMDPDGNNAYNLFAGTDWLSSTEDALSWSPDGKYMVVQSNRSGNLDLWIFEVANPANVAQITDTPWNEGEPHWQIAPLTPIANAGDNIQIASAEQIHTVIQGTATDPDGDILEYRWLEGEQVLLDWSAVDSGGEAYLDLSTLPYFSIGNHTLILEAREVKSGGLSASDDMVLTIENSPPVVQAAPKHQVVEVGIDPIVVVGDAGDFDGDTLVYEWLDDSNNVLASGTVATTPGGEPVTIPDLNVQAGDTRFPVGEHTVRLQVSDGINEPVTDSVSVEVTDTTAPSLSPVPSVTILWPPNHKLIPVTIWANAFDNGGGDIVLSVTVQSSEPADAIGDGNTDVDYYIDSVNNETGVIELRLRSERSGKGGGRVYTITITATDANQNQSQAVVQIRAPHDKSKK